MPAATRTRSSSLICRTAVKKYTFSILPDVRPGCEGKMTRISEDFYILLEAKVRAAIANHLRCMPSAGKTIR